MRYSLLSKPRSDTGCCVVANNYCSSEGDSWFKTFQINSYFLVFGDLRGNDNGTITSLLLLTRPTPQNNNLPRSVSIVLIVVQNLEKPQTIIRKQSNKREKLLKDRKSGKKTRDRRLFWILLFLMKKIWLLWKGKKFKYTESLVSISGPVDEPKVEKRFLYKELGKHKRMNKEVNDRVFRRLDL